MNSRLASIDSTYRRRMIASYPSAIALMVLGLINVPTDYWIAPDPQVALQGPLQILPEIDISETEENTDRTAAPAHAPLTDFVAIDIEYAYDPKSPEPIPIESPPTMEKVNDEAEMVSTADDQQDAAETTGHPVLADTEYELIYMQRPVYPREAVNRGVEGQVRVMMLIDAQGRVSQAHVENPNMYPLLESAALEAVFKSLFRPHIQNGVATPFWIRVPFDFRLVG